MRAPGNHTSNLTPKLIFHSSVHETALYSFVNVRVASTTGHPYVDKNKHSNFLISACKLSGHLSLADEMNKDLWCGVLRLCVDQMWQQVEGIDSPNEKEERRVGDGFQGQALWSRRSCGGFLWEDRSSGKTHLLLSNHWCFVRSQQDKLFVKGALSGLVEDYSQQLLRSETDLSTNQELLITSAVFLVEMDGIRSRRKENI